MVVVDDIPIKATMRVDIANIQTQNRSLDKIEWGKNGKNRIIGYSEAGVSGAGGKIHSIPMACRVENRSGLFYSMFNRCSFGLLKDKVGAMFRAEQGGMLLAQEKPFQASAWCCG
jgi:hypothetical protein